jgi:uncharacterized RDD family membrane protein YckC
MARWTGTWLSGLGAAGVDTTRGTPPGVRLGLPATGPGSVAPLGTRVVAFAIDAVLCGLVARLFFPVRDLERVDASASLAPLVVFAVVYVLGLSLTGQTPGMRLRRLRVVPADPQARPAPAIGFVPAALRTALLMLLLPAAVSDADGRGLHDRAAGVVVVQA